MDKRIINNKKVREVVTFKNFFFSPYFNYGEHEGTFCLCAYSPEQADYIVTSDIVDIHELEGVVYVETQNSVYQLDGTKSIRHLENVKKYLHDEKYTSVEFYEKCVPNMMPTSLGWKVL